MTESRTLQCPACGHQEPCGPTQMLTKLQSMGMLKRQKEPSWDLICALFDARIGQLVCPECNNLGVRLASDADLLDGDLPDDDWGDARCCEQCGAPIAAARLEVFPDASRCVGCQQSDERGEVQAEPDFCPRCGAVMQLRTSSAGGLTRYVLFCPDCRRSVS